MNVLMVGAHPDDCEIKSGGTALWLRRLGHRVKFLSCTNGVTGHQEQGGVTLARRRYEETQAVAAVLDIEYEVFDIASGELEPNLYYRRRLLQTIRDYRPDLVFTHRPNDYHPDHRATSQLVQDCSYVLTVPSNTPLSPFMATMPVICYFSDNFRRPYPFEPDVLVDVTEMMDAKLRALHCHTSQMYEWLPFNSGKLAEVPEGDAARLAWLREQRAPADERVAERYRELGRRLYGDRADGIRYAEAFESCEYGKALTDENRRELFPMVP